MPKIKIRTEEMAEYAERLKKQADRLNVIEERVKRINLSEIDPVMRYTREYRKQNLLATILLMNCMDYMMTAVKKFEVLGDMSDYEAFKRMISSPPRRPLNRLPADFKPEPKVLYGGFEILSGEFHIGGDVFSVEGYANVSALNFDIEGDYGLGEEYSIDSKSGKIKDEFSGASAGIGANGSLLEVEAGLTTSVLWDAYNKDINYLVEIGQAGAGLGVKANSKEQKAEAYAEANLLKATVTETDTWFGFLEIEKTEEAKLIGAGGAVVIGFENGKPVFDPDSGAYSIGDVDVDYSIRIKDDDEPKKLGKVLEEQALFQVVEEYVKQKEHEQMMILEMEKIHGNYFEEREREHELFMQEEVKRRYGNGGVITSAIN